jgi:D-glycero-D-manno-heptose 1,7-bisphosphate phosphatase
MLSITQKCPIQSPSDELDISKVTYTGKGALFLDRDGIINKDTGYVFQKKQFIFYNDIYKLCELAKHHELPIIIITNQAGIARGYYSHNDFIDLTRWMICEFKKKQIEILHVYYAPFHPDFSDSNNEREEEWRKPRPGMINEAIRRYKLCPKKSIAIGDKETDMTAAKKAHIALRILVNSQCKYSEDATQVVNNLTDAMEIIKLHKHNTRNK